MLYPAAPMGCLNEESVLGLVEGTLAVDARALADHHLARCAECRVLVARAAEALLSTGAQSEPAGAQSAHAPPRAPRSGESIGRYRVTSVLGTGAMGIVVAATDEQLGRQVALKLLRRDASAEVRERFVREARAASAIAHPGVVTIHDVLTTADGHPVIVMDHLHGETLRSRLGRVGRLELEETFTHARAIAAALEAAHARGIVHRDLKPENVFLTETGELKLLDFGVAKLLETALSDRAELTATGTIVGTPYYMAPEQAFGQKDVDARADLWSLGVIVYECLSGQRPFSADSVGQVLRLLALGELIPLRETAPHLPQRVVVFVERLLSPREQRPKSAHDVVRTIDELSSTNRLTSSPRRAPVHWVLALALAALAAGMGVWAIIGADRAREQPAPPLAAAPEAEPIHASTVVPTLPVPAAVTSSATAPSTMTRTHAPRPRVTASQASSAAPAPAPTADASAHGPGKLLTRPPF